MPSHPVVRNLQFILCPLVLPSLLSVLFSSLCLSIKPSTHGCAALLPSVLLGLQSCRIAAKRLNVHSYLLWYTICMSIWQNLFFYKTFIYRVYTYIYIYICIYMYFSFFCAEAKQKNWILWCTMMHNLMILSVLSNVAQSWTVAEWNNK